MAREHLGNSPQPGTIEWEMMLPPELRDPWIMAGRNDPEKRVDSFTRVVGPDMAFSLHAYFDNKPDPETAEEVARELEIRSRFLVPKMREAIQEMIDSTKPTAEILEFKQREK